MGWRAVRSKLNAAGKDKWIMVLGLGLVCLILAFPTGESDLGDTGSWLSVGSAAIPDRQDNRVGTVQSQSVPGQDPLLQQGGEETVLTSARATLTYEQQLEERLEEILSHVEGVGAVDVMIVLKTSEEKIWRIDQDSTHSITQETDQYGGNRKVENQEITQETILAGQSGQTGPILEKEIRPQISGIVISAAGGGNPQIQSEISAAAEALFDVPAHKIKELKRVE